MSHNETAKITALRLSDGTLPAYSDYGAYPLYYVDMACNALCPTCANDNDEFSERLVAYDVNYENGLLYCDHCSNWIKAAYVEEGEIA